MIKQNSKSRTSHHLTQIIFLHINFCLSIFFRFEQTKYLKNLNYFFNSIWLKITKNNQQIAENGRKSIKVFYNWLRTGKNDLG